MGIRDSWAWSVLAGVLLLGVGILEYFPVLLLTPWSVLLRVPTSSCLELCWIWPLGEEACESHHHTQSLVSLSMASQPVRSPLIWAGLTWILTVMKVRGPGSVPSRSHGQGGA